MKRISLLLSILLLAACATNPSSRTGRRSQASATPQQPTLTPWPSPTDTPAPSDTPRLTPTATFGVGSALTLTHDAICRMGPGESYYEVVPYFEKGAVLLQGRNQTGEWVAVRDVYIDDPVCWIPSAALAPTDGLDALPIADYPSLPAVPTSISAPRSVCGTIGPALIVKWSPVASGSEYRLYRNGELVSTQSGGSYYDLDVPKPQRPLVYTYILQTFNDYANSPFTLSVSVSVCSK